MKVDENYTRNLYRVSHQDEITSNLHLQNL